VDFIVCGAASTQLVIWGEEHQLPQTRSLYEDLVRRLWDQGYRYLAAEAFSNTLMDSETGDISYTSGLYLMDPVFASAIRVALELGYRLIPYDTSESSPDGESGFRDRRQAENIIERVFEADSAARVLVLAGRGHAAESAASDGWKPMAAVLKARTGINPLTIYAPTMSMRVNAAEEHPLYRAALSEGLLQQPVIFVDSATSLPLGSDAFDAYVFWPPVTIDSGREDWVFRLPGRHKEPIPFALPVDAGTILIQAFEVGRSVQSVPDDQILFRGGTPPALSLREGTYAVRAIRPDSRIVVEDTVVVE
jgi:hypothetical protein